jgi:hypothetical protein
VRRAGQTKGRQQQLRGSIMIAKTKGLSPTQAQSLVNQVFLNRGQPGVKATTKLKDIGYSQMINLYHLLASINQAIIDEYGKAYALSSSVTANWTTVGDVINSVQQT